MRMLISFGAAAACLLSSTLASPAPQDSPSATADTEVPQESACGYIVNTYDNSEGMCRLRTNMEDSLNRYCRSDHF